MNVWRILLRTIFISDRRENKRSRKAQWKNGTNNFAIFNNLIFHHFDSSWIKKLASWSFCIFYAQQIA